MNNEQESLSLDSTAMFSQQDSHADTVAASLKQYVKELLKGRIFLGRYMERRLVNQQVGYRDIVVVSPAEVDLQRELIESQQKIRKALPTLQWIGITDSQLLGYYPPGLCLWTEIDNQPFGAFWFQVKTVQFRKEEALVMVRCLRHITDAFLEAEPILTGGAKASHGKKKIDIGAESLAKTFTEIKESLRGALSISNVKELVTFLIAFIIAIFTGSTAFVNFLGNFILALIRETSLLVKNSTPFLLGVLDFFSKIVGGFYILLAMMFKPYQSVPPPKNNRRRLSYEPQFNDHFDSGSID